MKDECVWLWALTTVALLGMMLWGINHREKAEAACVFVAQSYGPLGAVDHVPQCAEFLRAMVEGVSP